MAVPITRLLFSTIESRGTSSGYVPEVFWIFFTGLNVVHQHCWFWIDKSRVWKMENAVHLGIGAGFQLVAGNNEVMKVMAKVVAIALPTVKAIGAMKRLERNYDRLWKILDGSEKIYVKVDWEKAMQSSFISPSTAYSLEELKLKNIERAKRLSNCILDIFRDIFLLSNHILDAKQAYYDDRFQVLHSVVNARDLIRDIQEDYTIVDDILAALGAPTGAEKFLKDSIDPGRLEKARSAVSSGFSKSMNFIKEIGIEIGKDICQDIVWLAKKVFGEQQHYKIEKFRTYNQLIIRIDMSDLSVIEEEEEEIPNKLENDGLPQGYQSVSLLAELDPDLQTSEVKNDILADPFIVVLEEVIQNNRVSIATREAASSNPWMLLSKILSP